ncbi:hypothetical protein DRI96_02185 [Candidatus Aerophobetes bacterium]|uniref:TonB C-terminal domain-containing protein n=1 Tax=Aerophobetes bacterium TaxID=2030807 RepID=A0A662DIJ8_UNCAE|nr:MAG: hypothetical protein DRI96_02185 [Candidatus Aerophobetes bacterium]
MKWWIVISILFHLVIFTIPLPLTNGKRKINVDKIKMTYRFEKVLRQQPAQRKIRKEKVAGIYLLPEKFPLQKMPPSPIKIFSSRLQEKKEPSFKVAGFAPSSKIKDIPDFYNFISFKKIRRKIPPSFSPQTFPGREGLLKYGQCITEESSLASNGKEKYLLTSPVSLSLKGKTVYSYRIILPGKDNPFLSYRGEKNLVKCSHLPPELLIFSSLGELKLKTDSIYPISLKNQRLLNYKMNVSFPPSFSEKNSDILTLSTKAYHPENFSPPFLKRKISFSFSPFRISKKIFRSRENLFYKTSKDINHLSRKQLQISLSFKDQQIKKIPLEEGLPVFLIKGENFIQKRKIIIDQKIKIKKESPLFLSDTGLKVLPGKFSIRGSKVKRKGPVFPPRIGSIVSPLNLLVKKEFYQKRIAPSSFFYEVMLPPWEEIEKIFSSPPSPLILTNSSVKVKSFPACFVLPKKKDKFTLPPPDSSLINTVNYSSLIKKYIKKIARIINKNKKYPPYAREKGEEGKVEVSFKILKDGDVKDIKIISPSKYAELNKATRKLIEDLSPFPPFPPEINKNVINIKMEVIYELKEEY